MLLFDFLARRRLLRRPVKYFLTTRLQPKSFCSSSSQFSFCTCFQFFDLFNTCCYLFCVFRTRVNHCTKTIWTQMSFLGSNNCVNRKKSKETGKEKNHKELDFCSFLNRIWINPKWQQWIKNKNKEIQATYLTLYTRQIYQHFSWQFHLQTIWDGWDRDTIYSSRVCRNTSTIFLF